MTHKQLWLSMALIALAVIGLGACRQTPTSTTEPAATGEAAGTEAPPGEGSAEAEEIELTLGPGDVDVPDPAAGLADLDSYRATLTVSFDGTEGGAASQWTHTRIFTRGNNPPVTVEEIEGVDPASGDAVLIVTMGDTLYEQDANGGCMSYPAGEEVFTASEEPVSALPPVYGAERIGDETVNGVETVHASFDARALGIPHVSEAEGEVWVAGNGMVMRYHLTGSAGPAMLGEGSEGTLSYDYEINEMNPVVNATPPDACPQGEVAATTPPDAQNVESAPGTLRFDSAADITGITAFYQQELPAAGWEQAQEPITGEGAAILLFRQGEQEILITLEAADQGTHVELHQRPILIPPPPPEGTPGLTPTP